jgi:hypothetical protein
MCPVLRDKPRGSLVTAGMVPWGAWSVWLGRTWRMEDPPRTFVWLLCGVVTISLVQWCIRLAIK